METPFAEYKATELSLEQLQEYFVEPRYISRMYSNNVSFIIGQRGTGKTTLLKHLCSSYNRNDGEKRIVLEYIIVLMLIKCTHFQEKLLTKKNGQHCLHTVFQLKSA